MSKPQSPAEPPVLVSRDGTMVTVTINRPHKLNALTKPVWARLGEVFTELSADDTLRCIVLRGAGEQAFSPGNDIEEFATARNDRDQAVAYAQVAHATAAAIDQCRHPIVAQIHGIYVGGGLLLASLCDLRICGESCRFGVPIKNLGLVMAYAEMSPIVRLVGGDKALELLLEGRILNAREGLAMGLVSRVVADGEVAAEARATAQRIADGAPLVARWHKKFVRRLRDPRPLDEAETLECYDCFATEDFQTGYHAFLAKKKPEFHGR